MGILIRAPHGFLRRHFSAAERVLAAAGMSWVLYQLLLSLPAYPTPWEIVVAVTVFLVMLWSPPVAYFVAVTAALYPLYTLSLYLAVLFLAIALLGQRIFIHNLGATLLVLLAPWLAQFHLEWLAVLLGGLWWGKTAGAWIGGMAALWGQVLFGMTGQSPNWLDMMGIQPATQGMFATFKDANSLDTLKLIVTPLAPNPTLLLYHLLQVVLWAMVAGLIGGLAERGWTQQKHPWRAIATAIFGAAGMVLANLGLANWLDQYKPGDFAWIAPGLLESAAYAALIVVIFEGLRDFIEHPLPVYGRAPAARQAAGAGRAAGAGGAAGQGRGGQTAAQRMPLGGRIWSRLRTGLRGGREPAAFSTMQGQDEEGMPGGPYQPMPVPTDLPRRDAKKQRPDDIIKIELD